MPKRHGSTENRLDDAARAGWLYYIAGNTQDEIAAKLGISRQSAQRLVSLTGNRRAHESRLPHIPRHA
jgi:DNA-binding transcriptional regulator LsrR (DeoR family)